MFLIVDSRLVRRGTVSPWAAWHLEELTLSTWDREPLAEVVGNDNGVGVDLLIRRLRRRQDMSQERLADRVLRLSGNHAINGERVQLWEAGEDVPDKYWRRWLAMALGVPTAELERAAIVSRSHNRSRRRPRPCASDK